MNPFADWTSADVNPTPIPTHCLRYTSGYPLGQVEFVTRGSPCSRPRSPLVPVIGVAVQFATASYLFWFADLPW